MNNRGVKKLTWGGVHGSTVFESIIAPENLFSAWREFKKGKSEKRDVQEFVLRCEENIFAFRESLQKDAYAHDKYTSFYVRDPKLRHIHKASVRDRVLHHAVVRILEPIFEKIFITDSYSCRKNKGTHRAVRQLRKYAWKVSRNNTRTVWVLQCDIKKFFDTIDHTLLIRMLYKKIRDPRAQALLENIIKSFETQQGKGIPLGNLTSQLFANIYVNALDQFIKRTLKVRYYIRYTDDIVMIHEEKAKLEAIIPKVKAFLSDALALQLHPQKISLRKWHQGIDYLGYVVFPHHVVLRTKTKKRMLKKIRTRWEEYKEKSISREQFQQSMQSYYGLLRHCRSATAMKEIESIMQEHNTA